MIRFVLTISLVLLVAHPGHAQTSRSSPLQTAPAIFRPDQNTTRLGHPKFRTLQNRQTVAQPVSASSVIENDLASVQLDEHSEAQLLSDIADGQLDSQSLMDAALIIGGVSNELTMRECQGRWRAFQTLMANEVDSENASDSIKAMQLFRFMHNRILTGEYVEQCNAIDAALLHGDYNCVTATILFCCLARECGLVAKPESLPAHVRCRVFDSETEPGSFHVETTDPTWNIDAGTNDTATIDAIDASATDDWLEAGAQITGRLLSDVEVLAKLFYNRGLDQLARGDFAGALEATELSWQLDSQHEAARDNVATVINNWALDLSARHEFEQALSLLQRGQEIVPDHPILYANQTHIHAAWQRDKNSE